jgi:hypothetical protein
MYSFKIAEKKEGEKVVKISKILDDAIPANQS